MGGNASALWCLAGCKDAAEKNMKIYLLIMLIGALLTAIHFTAPERQSNTLPH
jgi:hypothetical protein